MNQDLLYWALTKYGDKEVSGDVDSSSIMQMAKDCGFDSYVHDEISWCSLFVNWVALQAKYTRSGSLAARSWLNIGFATATPEIGDVVVLWRESPQSWKGHVGLFIRHQGTNVYILGGNQGNMVNISAYPATQILGYKVLEKIESVKI